MRPRNLLNAARRLAGGDRVRSALEASAEGASIHPTAEVRSPERLALGARVVIDYGALLHCGGMEWSAPDAGISIGDDSYVGPNSTLFGGGGIEIAAAVLVSPGVVLTSHQHTFEDGDGDMRTQPLEFGRIVIERDVWIGANATVLPGIRIGTGAVIGAGAVITHDVPAGAVMMGVPARAVRER